MRRLCILHVTPYFEDAWAYGGIPRVAGALTRALAARGHQVTVCTTDVCTESARLEPVEPHHTLRPWPPRESGGAMIRVFPNVSNTLAYRQLFAPIGLNGYLKHSASRFDVAHIHACRNLPAT